MKKALALIFIICNAVCFASPKKQETLPVTYYPASGVYTAPVTVDGQKIDAILDTGSSNFNIVGDKSLCKHCKNLLTKHRYSPSKKAQALNDYFSMRYASAQGRLSIYRAPVKLDGTTFEYLFSVFRGGKNMGNDWGLAYRFIAEPREYPLPTLLGAWARKVGAPYAFILKLSPYQPSSMIIGKPPKLNPKKWQFTPIVKKDFYHVLLQSVTTSDGKVLASFGPSHIAQTAIIDSGTTGVILLPDSAAKSIKAYVKHHAQVHGQTNDLPTSFWKKNWCANRSEVNFKAYPTLVFHFAKWGRPDQSIHVDVPPKNYLTTGGCGKQYVRFAIVSAGAHNVKKLVNTKKFQRFHESSKVLGAPLLENHAVLFEKGSTFNTNEQYRGRIGFGPFN